MQQSTTASDTPSVPKTTQPAGTEWLEHWERYSTTGVRKLRDLYEAFSLIEEASTVLNELEVEIDQQPDTTDGQRLELRRAAGIPQANEVLLAIGWLVFHHTGEATVKPEWALDGFAASVRSSILHGHLFNMVGEGVKGAEIGEALDALGAVCEGIR